MTKSNENYFNNKYRVIKQIKESTFSITYEIEKIETK